MGEPASLGRERGITVGVLPTGLIEAACESARTQRAVTVAP